MTRVVYIYSARSISTFRNNQKITASFVGYCRIGRTQGPILRATQVRQVRRVMISSFGIITNFLQNFTYLNILFKGDISSMALPIQAQPGQGIYQFNLL